MNAYYDPQCNESATEIDSTRKHKLIAEKVSKLPGIQITKPYGAASPAVLASIHSPVYVKAILEGVEPLASSPGIPWDNQTFSRAASACATLQSAVLTASEQKCSGAICSGFHHAGYDSGMGFCTFNGLILAALTIQASFPRVLILDLDFHYGNGTDDIIYKLALKGITNMTIFGSKYARRPNESCNAYLYGNPEQYEDLISNALREICKQKYDFVIYQAGMDPHQHSVDGMPGITAKMLHTRDRAVFQMCQYNDIPVAFCMAGGYTTDNLSRDQLAELHCGTFKEALAVFAKP